MTDLGENPGSTRSLFAFALARGSTQIPMHSNPCEKEAEQVISRHFSSESDFQRSVAENGEGRCVGVRVCVRVCFACIITHSCIEMISRERERERNREMHRRRYSQNICMREVDEMGITHGNLMWNYKRECADDAGDAGRT